MCPPIAEARTGMFKALGGTCSGRRLTAASTYVGAGGTHVGSRLAVCGRGLPVDRGKESQEIIEVAVTDGRLVADVSGTGDPVVLVHSGISDRHMWTRVVPGLE